MTTSADTLARWARFLGLGGLIPFVTLALGAWLGPVESRAALFASQVQYAASILTFIGALHWGIALAAPAASLDEAGARRALVWSVTPSLYCWLAATQPPGRALALLAAGLAVALVVDERLYRTYPVPRWFIGLRRLLTAGACASLLVTWLAAAG